MGKVKKIIDQIDWSAMKRNNQYKEAPTVGKSEVAEPMPAKASDNGQVVVNTTLSKKVNTTLFKKDKQ